MTGPSVWDGYAAAAVCEAGVRALEEGVRVEVELVERLGVLPVTASFTGDLSVGGGACDHVPPPTCVQRYCRTGTRGRALNPAAR